MVLRSVLNALIRQIVRIHDPGHRIATPTITANGLNISVWVNSDDKGIAPDLTDRQRFHLLIVSLTHHNLSKNSLSKETISEGHK